MTTVSTLIDQTMSWLHPGGKGLPSFDILASNITSGAASLTTQGLQSYTPQTVIEFDDYVNNVPSEQALTKEAESSTAVDLNERGYLNTTAQAHTAGVKLWLSPRFTKQSIFEAIQAITASLYGMGLYRLVQDTSLSYDTTTPVALPTGAKDIDSILVVYANRPYPLTEQDYALLTTYDPPKLWFYGGYPQGSALVVNVRKDFTVPTLVTDDMTTTCGVPASLVYHFPLGVAGYLLSREELPRVILEDVRSRAAAEGVQVGAARSVGESMLSTFENKFVTQERNNQIRRTPVRVVT